MAKKSKKTSQREEALEALLEIGLVRNAILYRLFAFMLENPDLAKDILAGIPKKRAEEIRKSLRQIQRKIEQILS